MSSNEPTEPGVEITSYVGPTGARQEASASPTHKADASQTPKCWIRQFAPH